MIRKNNIQVTDKQFKKHELDHLFNLFDVEYQNKIINISAYVDYEFRELLKNHNNMFDTWRYAYEKYYTIISEVGFMDTLVSVLSVLADQA